MRRRKAKPRSGGEEDTGREADAGGCENDAGDDVAELDEASCRDRAVALLARREHSRAELERKLRARGFDASVVAAALTRLENEGTLADARFTSSFVRTRAAKGKGPARIRAELAERGIAKDEARSTLAQSDVDWAAEAAAVRRKRFGPELPRDFKERARQARFLQYRGFEQRHIEAAFSGDSAEQS